MKVERMTTYIVAALLVCLFAESWAQYYGSGAPPTASSYGNVAQSQNQNAAAWRRWYQQQAEYQKQLAEYNARQAAAARNPQQIASTAASSRYAQYYRQNQAQQAQAQQAQQAQQAARTQAQTNQYASRYQQQPAQPQYRQQQSQYQQQQQQQRQQQQQQYYQQRQQQQPHQQYRQPQPQPRQQQQYSGYRPPQNAYQPAPRPTPPPTTTPVPGEIEIEYEVPTTTTTAAPRTYNQWGHYSYNSNNAGYYGGQQSGYQQQPQQHHQQSQQQPTDYNNYFQQPHQPQHQPQHQSQPHPQPHQQPGWNQGPNQPQDAFGGGGQGSPGGQDPFGNSGFEVNGLKPTIFNPQYQPPQQQPPQNYGQPPQNEFAGIFGQQNPIPPQGKTDFGSRGPNPIQMNQFLSQAASPKDQNALTNNLDALLGKLLGDTAGMTNQQAVTPKPTPKPTTKAPPPSGPSLISDRLNGFDLGPQSQFRSNRFSEIPTNSAHFDSLNPLAGFIGETPAPPTTTTPPPPGRNGDFLAGFIGTNKGLEQPKASSAANEPPHIYFYNYMNDRPQTTEAPAAATAAGQSGADSALNNLGTQDLSAMVQKLLGVLAAKQAAAGQGAQG